MIISLQIHILQFSRSNRFFCEHSQYKLSLFVRLETGRHDEIISRRKLEPPGHLPEVNEGVTPGAACVVAEKVRGAPAGLRVPEGVDGEANREKVEALVPHGPPTSLHQVNDHGALVLRVALVRVLEADQELGVVSEGLDVVPAAPSR